MMSRRANSSIPGRNENELELRAAVPAALGALAVSFLLIVGCTKEPTDPGPTDPPQSSLGPCDVAPSPPENITDFPCPPNLIKSWVAENEGVGDKVREHGWYLFAGINQPVTTASGLETQNWRTWPTSTQAFPNQYGDDAPGATALGKLDVLPPGGGRLERPAVGTPGHTKLEVETNPPGIIRSTLTLPNSPIYAVPTLDNFRQDYSSCLLTSGGNVTAVRDGQHFQNNGDVMIGGVIYNETAKDSINSSTNQLWNAGYLDTLLPATQEDPPAQVWMQDHSIALKTMLWPVPGDSYVPLPLWDASGKMSDIVKRDEVIASDGTTICETYSGFERQTVWSKAAALTAGNGVAVPTEIEYLVDGSVTRAAADATFDPQTCAASAQTTDKITYGSSEFTAESLDSFYTQRFTTEQFQGLSECDRALIDQSAIWSYGRRFDPEQDALVLIAMHIMTKEQTVSPPNPAESAWTFQSAWWSNCDSDADCGSYNTHRPDSIAGNGDTWKNYLITSTYGMRQKPGKDKNVAASVAHPGVGDGTDPITADWPVAFNPYIELAATHPVETNCINCHIRAGWPGHVIEKRKYPEREQASYLAENGPSLLHSIDFGNQIFKGQVTLDSMWAISDRARYNSPADEDPSGD